MDPSWLPIICPTSDVAARALVDVVLSHAVVDQVRAMIYWACLRMPAPSQQPVYCTEMNSKMSCNLQLTNAYLQRLDVTFYCLNATQYNILSLLLIMNLQSPEELLSRQNSFLWWHISAITCRIIMLTCQVITRYVDLSDDFVDLSDDFARFPYNNLKNLSS